MPERHLRSESHLTGLVEFRRFQMSIVTKLPDSGSRVAGILQLPVHIVGYLIRGSVRVEGLVSGASITRVLTDPVVPEGLQFRRSI